MDELRYFIMSRPQVKQPQPQMTAVQKDKARLARKISKNRRAAAR